MRDTIIAYLRNHPKVLSLFWNVMRITLLLVGVFFPVKNRTALFASFGGRQFDDSPRAIYEEMLQRKDFDNWDFIWAFVNPAEFNIPRGRKIKIDTWAFFKALLQSNVWVSNSGMDRNIGINRAKTIKIETWHGTPIKKIGMDQNSGALGNQKPAKRIDEKTIRCAQSKYDREIFERLFSASKESFLMSDLPRNDALFKYSDSDIIQIKKKIGIPTNKKTILYMPTYREFQYDEKQNYSFSIPMNTHKWAEALGKDYCLIVRKHYATNISNIVFDDKFTFNVSEYPKLADLYAIADILISDYSSAFFDFSILEKPFFCYAFDYEEYKEKRGFYKDLYKILPCKIHLNEITLINDISNMKYDDKVAETRDFHLKYTPNAGEASNKVVNVLIERLHQHK